MAAQVGLAAVSYGIGVTNRYSAFLDPEDGFVLSNLERSGGQTGGLTGRPKAPPAAKQAAGGSSTNVNKTSSKQVKSGEGQKGADKQAEPNKRPDNRRPRANQGANGSVQVASGKSAGHYKQGNIDQENTANLGDSGSRFVKTSNSNHHHQSNASQHHQQQSNFANNKENNDVVAQQSGKFVRTSYNQRPGFNRRQFQASRHEDPKLGQQPAEVGATFANGASEEEKRRRQQKRDLDLKHKDPEKREARRQQVFGPPNNEQSPSSEPQEASDPNLRGQRRDRRQDAPRNQEDGRQLRAQIGGRGQGGRPDQDGQPAGARAQRSGDRVQRNRSGLSAGLRNTRGSRSDDIGRPNGRESERQKPIPNFSDKLDFPSLAS